MGKKKAEAEVDFNAMVEETRAKMQEKAGQAKKAGRKQAATPAARLVLDIIGQRAHFPYQDEAGTWRQAEGTVFSDSHKAGHMRMALYGAEGGVEYVDVPDAWLSYVGPSEEEEQLGVIGKEIPAPEFPEAEPRKAESEVAPESLKDVATLAPAELPGTPVLLPADQPAPGALGVFDLPLDLTARSNCNVRTHYVPEKIQELSASLKEEGQLQETVGRWNGDGLVEIVAGESRRRAQLLRQEAGEIGLTLRVNVRELSDAQALKISALENMQRSSMTPLEECEAMLRMKQAGESPEGLQVLFGYKSLQPVLDRILVAESLMPEAREQLDQGKLSFSKAAVIARAPGQQLQKQMLSQSTYHDVRELGRVLTSGQFLVSHAKFTPEGTGLEIKNDMFGAFEPYFLDKKAALERQIGWANTRAEKLRKKGKHPFVAVETGSGPAYNALHGHRKYEHTYGGNTGLIIYINTDTGQVSDENHYRLKAAALEKAQSDGVATEQAVAREMPNSAYEAAHILRAEALRHQLAGDHHRTLVLTVHALAMNIDGSSGRAALHSTDAWQSDLVPSGLVGKLSEFQDRIGQLLGREPDEPVMLGGLPGEVLYGKDGSVKLYEALRQLSTEELLTLLNALVASRIYEPTHYDMKQPTAPFFCAVARNVDASAHLRKTFVLTDQWLKRYPRRELLALAREAGLEVEPLEGLKTAKEIRGRILEHADELHARLFVPVFAHFPASQQEDVEDEAAD